MQKYHKINSIYKRAEDGRFLAGQFSRPEFEYLYNNHWIWTEKVDGTNIRIAPDGDGGIRVGGRTDNAQIPAKLLEAINGLELGPKFQEHFTGIEVCLYGEGYGAGIQKGGNYRQDQGFVLFDVKIGIFWLSREDVDDVADKLGIHAVPTLLQRNMAWAEGVARQGFGSTWGAFPAEGMVGTPAVPLFNRQGKRVIVKLKTKDYTRGFADERTT